VQWAIQEINISGGTAEQVLLHLRDGVAVSGRVQTLEGSRPEWLGGVVFSTTGQAKFLTAETVLHAGANPAGVFTVTNLVPGRFAIEARPMAEGWRLSSALFGSREAMDFLVDVGSSGTPPGVLTLTNRDTELSGTVLDVSGAPTRAVTLVLFSADERHWVPNQRRNQFRVPSVDGHFTFKDLPAGRYWLAAVADFDPVAGISPDLLHELAGSSPISLTIAEGEKKRQDIRLR